MSNIIKGISNIIKKLNYILSSSQKKRGVAVFILMAFGSFLEMLGVSIIIPLVTAMLYPEKLVKNQYIAPIMKTLHLNEDFPIAIIIACGVIIIYILKNLYLIFLSYIRSHFSCKVQRELSVELMKTYMKREYTFFLDTNTSELLRSISEDVARVHNMITYIFRIISELLTLSLICIFIMSADFMMAFSTMMVAGSCLVVVSLAFRGRMKIMGKERMKYDTMLKQDAYQAFQGIKEIMVMNRSQFFADKYEAGWKKQQKAIINETVASESPAFIIEAVCVAGLILTVCVRIIMGGEASTFLPQLAAFAVGAFRILPAVSRITSTLNLMNYYLPGIDSVYSNLKAVEQFAQDPEEVVTNEKEIKMDDCENKFNNKLEIKQIFWNYPNSEVQVLSGLCMEIKKGTSVGLVGSSGAGKTTLADILLGLLKPNRGQILVDGKDIRELGGKWSSIIGYVPQSVFLIDDTIRNNIGFGISTENINDEQVWKTLEQAQLKNFVESLPKGLDTLVGERGVKFSGGQRQRIAIARALYTNPEILVLDEATSALDNETETAVMESIEALQGYKTLIIVAHRLSTIEKCDVVYEIGDGIAKIKK